METSTGQTSVNCALYYTKGCYNDLNKDRTKITVRQAAGQNVKMTGETYKMPLSKALGFTAQPNEHNICTISSRLCTS